MSNFEESQPPLNQEKVSSPDDQGQQPQQQQPQQEQQQQQSSTDQIQPQVVQLAGQDYLTPLPVPNPPNATSSTSSSPPRTLWMGDLDPWSDEESIINLWSSLGKRVLVKLIKAKKGTPAATLNTGHAGYCFIEFESYDDAKNALSLNGSQIPNTNRLFRLNWASGATLSSPIPQSPEYSLFVGDLSPSTTEAHLLALFQTHYKSVKTVRVMTDPITGTSRCFGFVRFSDEEDRTRALNEMSGVWCAGRPLRVALATPRNMAGNNLNNLGLLNPPQGAPIHPGVPQTPLSAGSNQYQQPPPLGQFNQYQQQQPPVGQNSDMLMYQYQQIPPPLQFYHPDQQQPQPPSQFPPGFNPDGTPVQSQNSGPIPPSSSINSIPPPTGSQIQQIPYSDPNNTTVFVGGLASGVAEHTLSALFQPFGNILHVKIPPGKGCGFIRFEKREDAEGAIAGMQGFQIGGSRVRLSWGRQQNNQRLQMAALAVAGVQPMSQPPLGQQVAFNQGLSMENQMAAVSLNDDPYRLQQDLQFNNNFAQSDPNVNNLYYLPNEKAFEYDQYQQDPQQSQSAPASQRDDSKSVTPDEVGTGGTSSSDEKDGSKLKEMYRAAIAGKLDSLN